MKKILITGGSGLLGTYLIKEKPEGYDLYPTYYNGLPQWRMLDITDKLSIYRLFSDFKFDVVIHTAGLGNVDFCEQVPHISDLVNYEGTKNLIDILNELKHKPLFIHISTNAVYDGNNPLYTEESEQRPINKYGFSKKLAEEYVAARYDGSYLIVRPFMLFGWSGKTGRKNWLDIITEALCHNREMDLIDDIFWQPTSISFAAKAIYSLIDKAECNTSFNLSQGETMSLYDFACLINPKVFSPISHAEFKTTAKRPIDTSYDISKLSQYIEVPTVKNEIERMLK